MKASKAEKALVKKLQKSQKTLMSLIKQLNKARARARVNKAREQEIRIREKVESALEEAKNLIRNQEAVSELLPDSEYRGLSVAQMKERIGLS